MRITIYHNPKCSNSRGALAIIREAGHEPTIIEYLQTPLHSDDIRALLATMNAKPRDIIRVKESVFAELHLDSASNDKLIDAIAAHPILLNRPIVVTDKGARLCRPPELVRELL